MMRLAAALLLLTCFHVTSPVPAAAKSIETDWPTFNGDYSGKRYSELSQVNQSNVGHLTLAWVSQPQSVGLKSTPLEVNGILYFTIPDHIFALNARTGESLWQYDFDDKGGHLVGQRGVGM